MAGKDSRSCCRACWQSCNEETRGRNQRPKHWRDDAVAEMLASDSIRGRAQPSCFIELLGRALRCDVFLHGQHRFPFSRSAYSNSMDASNVCLCHHTAIRQFHNLLTRRPAPLSINSRRKRWLATKITTGRCAPRRVASLRFAR